MTAAPYNGCPDGPRPPDASNNPYVRIQSLTGDDYSTGSRKVVLRLNWPKGTTSALVRNARSRERVRGVGQTMTWRLAKGKAGVRAVRILHPGEAPDARAVASVGSLQDALPHLASSIDG